MGAKEIKIARDLHVVGGGCFGTQYVKWLLRARNLGMLRYEKILAVDRNPHCRLAQEGLREPSLQLVQSDWIDYFTDYLLENYRHEESRQDYWVPAPLSPHILFLGFLRGAKSILDILNFQEKAFQQQVPTPVQIPLTTGNLAVSFAEWQCPVNCIEPSNCPAIHAPRTWDMKRDLEGYFAAGAIRELPLQSAHVLQCRHWVHGVGTIPMGNIFDEFEKMLENLKSGKAKEVVVATTSGCHGLIGSAAVL